MDKLRLFLGGQVIFVLAVVLRGLVLSCLWGWFIATPLHVSEISPAVAIGIGLLLRFSTYYPEVDKTEHPDPKDRIAIGSVVAIGLPLFALLFGFIIKLFA